MGGAIWEKFKPIYIMGRIPKLEIEEIVSSDVFRRMRSLNLVDETELRNLLIKDDYKKLRNTYTSSRAIEILMEKYSLSDTSIQFILFHNRPKKSKTPKVFQ